MTSTIKSLLYAWSSKNINTILSDTSVELNDIMNTVNQLENCVVPNVSNDPVITETD